MSDIPYPLNDRGLNIPLQSFLTIETIKILVPGSPNANRPDSVLILFRVKDPFPFFTRLTLREGALPDTVCRTERGYTITADLKG